MGAETKALGGSERANLITAWLPRKHLADAMAPGHEAKTDLSGREEERELNSIELEDK